MNVIMRLYFFVLQLHKTKICFFILYIFGFEHIDYAFLFEYLWYTRFNNLLVENPQKETYRFHIMFNRQFIRLDKYPMSWYRMKAIHDGTRLHWEKKRFTSRIFRENPVYLISPCAATYTYIRIKVIFYE